jgi:GT2 family glycosyltransferase
LNEGCNPIIIVDNGSSCCASEALIEFQASHPEIVSVVRLATNAGSAGGFATGIKFAMESEAELIWLLDDDTVPEPGALEVLIEAHQKASQHPAGSSVPVSDRHVAVLALRPKRPLHQTAAMMGSIRCVYPSRSSFLNFSVADLPWRLRARFRSAGALPEAVDIIESLPYAPYGGLLFHRRTPEHYGLPLQELFSYEDDTEWTYRWTSDGGEILLVMGSRLDELEPSWYSESSGSPFRRLLRSSAPIRTYYASRNRVYFECHMWRKNSVMYELNKAVFLSLLLLEAWRLHEFPRFCHIYRAVCDGEAGILGSARELGL